MLLRYISCKEWGYSTEQKIQRQNNFNSMLLLDTEQLERKKSLLNRGGRCILCAFQYHHCCTRRNHYWKIPCKREGRRRNVEFPWGVGGSPSMGRHGTFSPSAMDAKSGWSSPITIPPSCIPKQRQECSAPAQKVHPSLKNKLQPCWGSL